MSVLVVHDVGTSLKEIIGQCKAKDFDRVFCRCLSGILPENPFHHYGRG